MVRRGLTTFYLLSYLIASGTLLAQSQSVISIYNNQAYYLRTEPKLLWTMLKGINPTHEFSLAIRFHLVQPIIPTIMIQKDFFQDSPEATAEIAGFKKAIRNQLLFLGESILVLASANEATLGYRTSKEGYGWAASMGIAFANVESKKALNQLYQAMHQHNLHILKTSLPTRVYDYFEAKCVYRTILLDGLAQIVLNGQPHDLPEFLRPTPDTDKIFKGPGPASVSYSDFKAKRRKATIYSTLAHLLSSAGFGSAFWTATTKTYSDEKGLLYLGILGTAITFRILESFTANSADNYLNHAVYLYNQQLLQDIVSGGRP